MTAISVYNRFVAHNSDEKNINSDKENNNKSNGSCYYNSYAKYTEFFAKRAELPLPIRQIREMVLNVFLRCCRVAWSSWKDDNNGTVP